MNRPLERRAGPLFGALLVVVGALAALTPAVPGALALDPTPDPAATPTLAPDPGASPDPTTSPGSTAAPDPTVSPTPEATPVPDPTASPEPTASPTPVPTQSPTGGLSVDHFWVDVEDPDGTVTSAGRLDDPRIGLTRFVVYRIRFHVSNDGSSAVRLVPTLLIGAGQAPQRWAEVPTEATESGQPFYVASDDGPTWRVRTKPIPAKSMRLNAANGPALTLVDGVFSAGKNPAPDLTLPPGSATEIEFAVRATVDAAWKSAYAFRLSLGDAPMSGQVDAPVSLGAAPPVELSPGQRAGVKVDDPLPAYKLQAPTGTISARLASATMPNAGAGVGASAPGPYTSPHENYTLTTDACGGCHATHSAPGEKLVQTPTAPISALCFMCHDGTGADSNILNQFNGLPPNDPSTSSYYSHPATAVSSHDSDAVEEFAGVHNRHSVCTDCHQAHNASSALAAPTTSGWTVGGAIKGASGVAVVNGAANTVPTYTWQPRGTYEYQLCFKCHSGYTTLNAQQAGFPSRWALDKGVELNPANLSYHPVEAEGKNQTPQMDVSLGNPATPGGPPGTAPGKLWTFNKGSVIRCENCHGPDTFANPAPDAQIDNHASSNRGILLRSYKDRVLKGPTEAYNAADSALCYLCHVEAPMRDESGDDRDDTNFPFHGYHMSKMESDTSSTATSIDTDGAGTGLAVCAECHFRIHGSSFPVDGQAPASRLVNFAPNTQPFGGQIRFVPRVGGTSGSCTLTCHGKDHEPKGY